MFEELNAAIREEVVMTLFHAEIELEEAGQLQRGSGGAGARRRLRVRARLARGRPGDRGRGSGGRGAARRGSVGDRGRDGSGGGSVATQQRVTSDREKNVGRNDPCWCGSGKKFKRCHGA